MNAPADREPNGKFVLGHAPSRRTHGLSNTAEYSAWVQMIARCENPNSPQYRNYGGRGISVCAFWRESFEEFYRHMGPRPSSKHSIDRYPDNDGNYEPGNCRWATPKQQAHNFRKNRWIEFGGRRMILRDWAREIGITSPALARRLKLHPLDVALQHGHYEYLHRVYALSAFCKRGHEFTPENTRWRKPGNKRSCRECDRIHRQEGNKRKRAASALKPWRSLAYRRWIAGKPSIIGGGASQCCHITHNGMASKGPDSETVPLSPSYHDQLDGRVKLPNGKYGKAEFEAFYGVNLLELAHGFYAEWTSRKGA